MYFPYQKGRYDVAPGLTPLTKDFGNGPWDQRLTQIGDDFGKFRSQFIENRTHEPAGKYVCVAANADLGAVGEISAFLASQLSTDYPNDIFYQNGIFQSKLTHEKFEIDAAHNRVRSPLSRAAGESLATETFMNYECAWDAIGAQIPDDIAIWKLNPDGSEEVEALHLNCPNHWAAADKIGKSFAAVHQPVAHIEKIVPWAVSLLEGIIHKGPYVRFAWGVGTDDRLNHHPEPAPGFSVKQWNGRSFDPNDPKLFVRVERQVLWGFPKLNRALFSIRTYFQDVEELKKTNPEAVSGLKDAIMSMSPQSLQYKGLTHDRDAIVTWLQVP
jgi:hypothetical protein